MIPRRTCESCPWKAGSGPGHGALPICSSTYLPIYLPTCPSVIGQCKGPIFSQGFLVCKQIPWGAFTSGIQIDTCICIYLYATRTCIRAIQEAVYTLPKQEGCKECCRWRQSVMTDLLLFPREASKRNQTYPQLMQSGWRSSPGQETANLS